MLMIRPNFFLRMDGSAPRVVWNADERLMAKIVPLRDRKLLQRCHMLNAGVVHEYVEAAECLERHRDHVRDGFSLRHVGWRIANLDSKLGDDSGLGLPT